MRIEIGKKRWDSGTRDTKVVNHAKSSIYICPKLSQALGQYEILRIIHNNSYK